MPLPFRDRVQAGRELAVRLRDLPGLDDVVVLGLPRGGAVVAAEVAAALSAPWDVLVVRKLGVPYQPELAMGAIAGGGVLVLHEELVRQLAIPAAAIEAVAARERSELARREREYRRDRPAVALADRVVVLVDDGLATGATMTAAVQGVRAHGPRRVVVAVPVGAPDSCRLVAECADELLCLYSPPAFGAVGPYYRDFTQTTDREVCDLLARQGEG
ncbi:MAG: phosphoribosyl transferase [Frankiales bacterium]|nr:phosphoribosyl transferase [Frankiales bacterium]